MVDRRRKNCSRLKWRQEELNALCLWRLQGRTKGRIWRPVLPFIEDPHDNNSLFQCPLCRVQVVFFNSREVGEVVERSMIFTPR